ncbi:hypothetical protein AB833_02250 [Chromatiales bacterium (ex Bugula neritina AB1)]|nr:hypothetical protein AB833_02250 [Chromatiales bacterium (ex Bugula neritina AB1)]
MKYSVFSLAVLSAVSSLLSCDGNSLNVTSTTLPLTQDSIEVEAKVPEPPLGFALPVRGSIYAQTSHMGGGGGSAFDIDCGVEKVLAGISGRAGSLIDQVTALCVSVDDDGSWIDSPARTGQSRGGGGGTAFNQTCPADHGVVGFTGGTENGVSGHLQLHCRRLVDNNSTAGTLQSLADVGGRIGMTPRLLCADQAVAKGIYGKSGGLVNSFGLNCIENPASAGRWSNVIDWPLIAIHSIVTPEGKVLSFGSTLEGEQGAHFHYDLWDPEIGTSPQSHQTLDNTLGVDSFCSAGVVIPDNGNVLMPGGDSRFGRSVNSGHADVPIFNSTTAALSRAKNMSFARWYPTATTLPDGDILLTGGIDGARKQSETPEIYSSLTDEWRSLPGINTSAYGYMYPRQWVAADGRVFGANGKKLYYLNTSGQGSLTAVGSLPNVAVGSGSTAVMYAPGKILQAGGWGKQGFGAVLIDINGGTPVVRTAESMSEPRVVWANSLVLPDGTVLVLGGTAKDHDASVAALGSELWDPETESWTQLSRSQLPRLYHSTSVLLKDGTVLLAGGGAPGPLINRNAEIFSPPYLYDANGSLKSRPEIITAPTFAAYGQTVKVHSSSAIIERVTLVKSSAVTHSWNMEQRFLELSFTNNNGVLDVVLPANANLATPGYYQLYVLDDRGTPSVARVLKMGTVPAPEVVIEPPTPEPPTTTPDNLLQNGGFELAKLSWNDCADVALTTASSSASDGAGAIAVESGGCLYQEFVAEPGVEYTFECDAAIGAADYASVFLQINDANYSELALQEHQILGSDYAAYRGTLEAPANAQYASLGLYSEGNSRFDRCSVVAGTDAPEPPSPATPQPEPSNANLLLNGGFEQQKNGWIDCSVETLTRASTDADSGDGALEISGAGCIYQEFQISAGEQYRLHCRAKSAGTDYTSLSWQITDQVRAELDAIEIPIGNTTYKSYEATLTAPQGSAHSAVTLYSEDTGLFDNCFVEAL